MKDDTKDQLLAILTQLAQRYPEMRFGQLVANVAGWIEQDVWDVEDLGLLQSALQHLSRVQSQGERIPAKTSNATETTRELLLDDLMKLIALRPDWRIGQTIANLATTAGRHDPGAVWDLEDDEALKAVRSLLTQYADSQTAVA